TCRARLYQRLAVSLERLGDCLLLGEKPDAAEAKRFYRKAFDVRHETPDDQTEAEQIKYRFKMAIASARCPDEDASPAARAVAAGELKAGVEKKGIRPEQVRSMAALAAVAKGLVGLRCPPGEKRACPRDQLFEFVRDQLNDRDRRGRLHRDDIELMILAARAL